MHVPKRERQKSRNENERINRRNPISVFEVSVLKISKEAIQEHSRHWCLSPLTFQDLNIHRMFPSYSAPRSLIYIFINF